MAPRPCGAEWRRYRRRIDGDCAAWVRLLDQLLIKGAQRMTHRFHVGPQVLFLLAAFGPPYLETTTRQAVPTSRTTHHLRRNCAIAQCDVKCARISQPTARIAVGDVDRGRDQIADRIVTDAVLVSSLH
jgi:hypothetical protein